MVEVAFGMALEALPNYFCFEALVVWGRWWSLCSCALAMLLGTAAVAVIATVCWLWRQRSGWGKGVRGDGGPDR